MGKREIRQKIKDLKEIIDLWAKFNNLIKEVQTSKAVTREQEDEFLNIKTTLAKRQQVLSGTPLKLMNVLSQATTLVDMANTPEMQAKKFYMDWHETYLSLNELLGRLESGKIEEERPKPVLREKRRGRGCLYHFILFIVFIILACICLRMYDQKYNLKSKLQGTALGEKVIENVEKFKLLKIFPSFEEMEEDEKGEDEGGEAK